MKTSKKIAIIIACCLITVGLLIGVVLFALLSLTNLTFFKTEKLEETYTFTEAFSDIDVAFEGDISFRSTDSDECRVTISGDKRRSVTYTAVAADDTLMIRSVDERKWYERIGIDFDDTRVVIELPKRAYDRLYTESVGGDIEAVASAQDLAFGAVELQSTSGNIFFEAPADGLTAKTVSGDLAVSNVRSGMLDVQTTSGALTVKNCDAADLNAQTTSGDLNVSGVNIVGDAEIQTTSGDLDAENLRCENLTVKAVSGDIDLIDVLIDSHIEMKTVSGDIEFGDCDAKALSIKTTSGDVEGTLLSSKQFLPDTTSGDIRLPHSGDGGVCEIKTTSGDIHVQIKE